MRSLYFLLLLFLTIDHSTCYAQAFQTKKDLSSEWKVYSNDRYIPFAERGEKVSTIYISIQSNQYAGDYLSISSDRSAHIFVNGRLVDSGSFVRLKLDSLHDLYSGNSLSVAVHQRNIGVNSLSTTIETSVVKEVDDLLKRQSSSFRDFAIIALLLLLIVMIFIIHLNPKLASDYFSITKIFSVREGDDIHVYSRIANSTNILFYLYCSLVVSYFMIITFHFVAQYYPIASTFHAESFLQAIVYWLELAIIILLFFFLKMLLVYILSYLFGVREVAGIHFFNWVRLLIMCLGILTLVLFVYFVTHGSNENTYSILLQLVAWILGAWIILIFFKLSGKISVSVFHLFSYICATELIPFLITIKVLYN